MRRVDALQKRLGRIIPFLFPYLSTAKRIGKRAGDRRRDFRKAWASAMQGRQRSGAPAP